MLLQFPPHTIFLLLSTAAYNVFSSFPVAYIFVYVLKGLDDAQPFLGYHFANQTLFSRSILFNIMCILHYKRDYEEQKAVVVV